MRMIQTALLLPLLSCAQPEVAADLPPRKPGLWEMSVKTTIQGRTPPAQVSQHCIDAEMDKAMRALELNLRQAKCAGPGIRRKGDAFVLDTQCRAGDTAFTAHGVSTGSFDADYTTTLTITRIGNPEFPAIPPKMTINTAARWTGACKIGQRPGDIVLPDGSKMNIRALPGMAELIPPPR
jgi:Protein of unknown function (DUF3617)